MTEKKSSTHSLRALTTLEKVDVANVTLSELSLFIGRWAHAHQERDLVHVARVLTVQAALDDQAARAGTKATAARRASMLAKLGKAAQKIFGIRSARSAGVRSLLELADTLEEIKTPVEIIVLVVVTSLEDVALQIDRPPTKSEAPLERVERVLEQLPASAKRKLHPVRPDADAIVRAALRALGFSTSEADDLVSNARKRRP